MRAVSLFILGMLVMEAATFAQEKKDPPKKVELKEPYKEYVTVKSYAGQKDFEFHNTLQNVQAYRDKSKDGKDRIYVNQVVTSSMLKAKSQIIDKDGVVWELTENSKAWSGDSGSEGSYRCVVRKLPDPKKP